MRGRKLSRCIGSGVGWPTTGVAMGGITPAAVCWKTGVRASEKRGPRRIEVGGRLRRGRESDFRTDAPCHADAP